jgi:hypothetical protein
MYVCICEVEGKVQYEVKISMETNQIAKFTESEPNKWRSSDNEKHEYPGYFRKTGKNI